METQEMTMTTQAIASRLTELCKQGKFDVAQSELFAEDAVSIEPNSTPDFQRETKGLEAIHEKGEKWGAMVSKTYSMKVSDPLVATNSFAVTMDMDVEMKDGKRMQHKELCVYEVKNGKVVSEQFFM
jgi:ketosteroid isomerase-like protein